MKSQHFLFTDIGHPYTAIFEEEPLQAGKPFLREEDELPNQPLTAPYANRDVYKGPYNHNDISDGLEDYYRSLVGQSGSGIRIDGASSNIHMSGNQFHTPYHFVVPLMESTHANPW